MMKNKFIILGIVGILTSSFMVGCNTNKANSNNEDNNIKVEDVIVGDDSEENKSDNDTSEKQEINIYTQDVNTDEEVITSKIIVEVDENIEDILEKVASKISEDVFEGLPIELVEVKEEDSNKIAVINLRESDKNAAKEDVSTYEGPNWAVGYFQGSAGGRITTNSLAKTFLQSDNKELKNWIDGVQFLYNNNPISFEHVEKLSEVIMR